MRTYVSILGDSISSFFLTIPLRNKPYYPRIKSKLLFPSQMWWAIMNKSLHWKLLVNESISGSCVADGYRNLLCASNPKRCLKLHKNNKKPNYIIVAMGVNDYSYNVPIDVFKESYDRMLNLIKNYYMESTIICISPWFTLRGDIYNSNGGGRFNKIGNTCSQYAAIIEELAYNYNLLYYDTAQIGFTEQNYYPTFCCDNCTHPTHPNKFGHKVMGEKLARFITNLIVKKND